MREQIQRYRGNISFECETKSSMANSDGWSLQYCVLLLPQGGRLLFKIVQQKLYSTSQWQQS